MQSTMVAKLAMDKVLNDRNAESLVMVETPPASIPETGDTKYTLAAHFLNFFATITQDMSVARPIHVSTLLAAWSGGDAQALPRLISAVYPELRRIARHHLGGRR